MSDGEIDLVPDELEDSDCVVYKCVDCETVYIPPEMQDKFILDEDVYFSVLALQRAYALNLIAGNLKQAEATMRIIDNIRSSYNGGSADGFYDFKDKDGAYVSNYKYQFDSYDDFYVEVYVNENTEEIIQYKTISAVGNALSGFVDNSLDWENQRYLEYIYNGTCSLLKGAIGKDFDSFSEASDMVFDSIKEMVVEDYIKAKYPAEVEFFKNFLDYVGVNIPAIKYTLAGIDAALELCNLTHELSQLPSNNYLVFVEYGFEDGNSIVFKGKYHYDDLSRVYGEDGIEPTDHILYDQYGKFRKVLNNSYGYWEDIIPSNS